MSATGWVLTAFVVSWLVSIPYRIIRNRRRKAKEIVIGSSEEPINWTGTWSGAQNKRRRT